jgi:hypothetical protein
MIKIDIKKELEIILFGILISYLILATNNFIWNTHNLFGYEYCPGDDACYKGVSAIFTAVAIDPRDQATIIFGGILIWIIVNIFDLGKLLKFKR